LGQLREGGVADVCIYNPDASWAVTPEVLRSQSKHTPFAFDMSGSEMVGQVRATVVAGKVAFHI
jgi:dihydroorotase